MAGNSEKPKPKIDRATLEKRDIEYYDIGEEAKLPFQAGIVRKGLLEFNIPLNRASTEAFLQSNPFKNGALEEIPDSVFVNRSLSEEENVTMNRYLQKAMHVAKEAQKLTRDG